MADRAAGSSLAGRGRRAAAAATVALVLASLPAAKPATAHPHIYVDAEIGLAIADGGALTALQVVWRFDAFHTLFALAFDDIEPAADGGLSPEAEETLIRAYTRWERGFDGFAKLSRNGDPIGMEPPAEVSARLVDDQLEIAFVRDLTTPLPLSEAAAEIAVYDGTYYHAVTVAEAPKIMGAAAGCRAALAPFNPDERSSTLRAALADLGREETPAIEDVGALFADRIEISCD
ncbi:MAG: DUF1007 family protein [Pseudomonadota bacterium]